MRNHENKRQPRHGAILLLTLFLMVFMLTVVSLSIDIGYLLMARTQLQDSADAAALAGACDLIDTGAVTGASNMNTAISLARTRAVQYAASNRICGSAPTVDDNSSNSTSGDVVVGYLSNPSDQTQTMDLNKTSQANAVQVRVQRSSAQNGEVKLFFSRLFGANSKALQATATAALVNNFSGFQAPGDGSNLMMLPYAIQQDTWNHMLSGSGSDQWAFNSVTQAVSRGNDGVREVNLFPQVTGAPGNSGTVDIGSPNNSTSDIARQIVYGMNASDLSYMPNGRVALNSQGTLNLNGDTGISAGVKDELASIIGEPRIIPIFSTVTGPGNNATYTIVGFAGVRIMNVKLTGSMSSKELIIEPANVTVKGGIPGTGPQYSNFVYSQVWLVR